MNLYYCEKCNNKISNFFPQNIINKYNYYFFCSKCLKILKVCSKSKCKKLFLLNNSDFKKLKIIYLNNTQHFFLYDDIKEIVLNKYGSFINLQNIINEKLIEKKLKIQKNNNLIADREQKLKESFQLNKLEFKNYGDCYSYIHYGEPTLEIVMENELKKINEKNSRRIILANELKKININLDESLK